MCDAIPSRVCTLREAQDRLRFLRQMPRGCALSPRLVPSPSNDMTRRECLQGVREILCRWASRGALSVSIMLKLRLSYIHICDSGRSFVNAADDRLEPPGNHLLMQQLAVPFHVSVKRGRDVGHPQHDWLHFLTMATTEVGTGCAKHDITKEAHHPEIKENSELRRTKPCCGVPCDHNRGAGCIPASNLRGQHDSPGNLDASHKMPNGWNQQSPGNQFRIAMFGSAALTNENTVGLLPHTRMSEAFKGICDPVTGKKVKKGASGALTSGTPWDRSFGSRGRPEVRDLWKVLPFMHVEGIKVTTTAVVEALRLTGEPGWQTNVHSHQVLPVLSEWLHSGTSV